MKGDEVRGFVLAGIISLLQLKQVWNTRSIVFMRGMEVWRYVSYPMDTGLQLSLLLSATEVLVVSVFAIMVMS